MKTPKRKKTAPTPPAPYAPGNPPPWLQPELRAAFDELLDRLRGSGAALTDADFLTVGRLVTSERDLEIAERLAADCPLTIACRANGEITHPIFRRIQELRAEVRSWMRLLPRPASPSRTSTKTAPTPTPATQKEQQPVRHELIERIRARIAALQQQQPGNAANTTTPAAATPAS